VATLGNKAFPKVDLPPGKGAKQEQRLTDDIRFMKRKNVSAREKPWAEKNYYREKGSVR